MLKIRFLFIIPVIIAGCRPNTQNRYTDTVSYEVINVLNESWEDVLVFINLGDTSRISSVMVRSNEVQLASQLEDNILWVCLDSMKANEKRTVTVYLNNDPMLPELDSRKRTQAELSYRFGGAWENSKYVGGSFTNVDELLVPPEQKDHSGFIRYEGPVGNLKRSDIACTSINAMPSTCLEKRPTI